MIMNDWSDIWVKNHGISYTGDIAYGISQDRLSWTISNAGYVMTTEIGAIEKVRDRAFSRH